MKHFFLFFPLLLNACSHETVRMTTSDHDAQQIFETELAKHPGNDKARTALGFLFLKTGQKDEAKAQWEAALNHNPKNGNALLGLATLDLAAEHADDAAKKLHCAIQVDPKFPNAHWVLGQILEQKGQKPEALKQYKAYRELLPRAAPHYERELSEVDAKITALSGN